MTDTLKPGWTMVKFGEVVRQVKDKVDARSSGLERYIAGEHMDTDDLRIRRWGQINDDYLGPAFHMRFKPGHVLYGSRRTYLRKVAVADFEGICANTTFVLEPQDSTALLPELLPFIMQTEAFHEYSIENSKGSVNPYINFSDLAQYEFALPPLAEQRRMAEVLWSQANITYRIQETIVSQEILKRSARIELFSRGLSPSKLIENSYLGTVPTTWEIKPIREIGLGRYGIVDGPFGSNLKRIHYRASGHPVIQSAFVASGYFDSTATEYVYVDDAKFEEQKRSKVRAGDIIMVKIGVNCGACALLPEDHPDSILAGNCLKITPNPDECNTKYLLHYLHWLHDIGRLERLVNSTQQRALSIGRLKTQQIALPPMEEQYKIASILDDIDYAQESLNNRLKSAQDYLKITRSKLLSDGE